MKHPSQLSVMHIMNLRLESKELEHLEKVLY